jgi:hypothetical protein
VCAPFYPYHFIVFLKFSRLDSAPSLPLTNVSNWPDVKNYGDNFSGHTIQPSSKVFLFFHLWHCVLLVLFTVSTSHKQFLLSSFFLTCKPQILTLCSTSYISYPSMVFFFFCYHLLNLSPSWIHCTFPSTDTVFIVECIISSTVLVKHEVSLKCFLLSYFY